MLEAAIAIGILVAAPVVWLVWGLVTGNVKFVDGCPHCNPDLEDRR